MFYRLNGRFLLEELKKLPPLVKLSQGEMLVLHMIEQ